MKNSYFEVGKPISDNRFIGRFEELKKIDFFIQQNQSLVIIAPRRYGKTSLIKKYLHDLDSNDIVIEIDLMRYISKKDLADDIINKCYKNIKYEKAIQDMQKGLLSFSKKLASMFTLNLGLLDIEGFERFFINDTLDENQYLLYAFEFIEKFARANNKKAIVFVDEFGELSKYSKDNSLLKQLRSIIQHQDNCCYIFAGSQPTLMNNIFLNKNEPFFKFATIIKLNTIKYTNFLEYCKVIFLNEKIQCEDSLIEELYNYCGGIAYNLSLSMMILLLNTKSIISDKLIEATEEDILDINSFGFENEVLLLKRRKNYFEIIMNIVKNKNPYELKNIKKQNVNNILKQLELDGIISKKDKYYINDTLFSKYLLREMS